MIGIYSFFPLCTCVPLSLTLFLPLLIALPLAYIAVLEEYSFSLLLSGKLLISPSILIERLAEYSSLGCRPLLFITWNIFSHSFTFSMCRSFVLRWVSCRQHICRSCFLIHSATLCLLIGAFNPFKIIIDKYLVVAIVFLYTYVPLSLCIPSS